jgi:hypothetical protein
MFPIVIYNNFTIKYEDTFFVNFFLCQVEIFKTTIFIALKWYHWKALNDYKCIEDFDLRWKNY